MKRKLTIFTFFLSIDSFSHFRLILSKRNKTTVFSSLFAFQFQRIFSVRLIVHSINFLREVLASLTLLFLKILSP